MVSHKEESMQQKETNCTEEDGFSILGVLEDKSNWKSNQNFVKLFPVLAGNVGAATSGVK